MKKILNNLKIRDPETGKFESVPGVVGEPAGINYSTEEVLTGDTWIDGKPIYRLSCMGATSTSPFIVGNLPEVPETVTSLTGLFKRSSDNNWFTIPNTHPSALTWSVNLSISNSTELMVTFGGSNTGTNTVVVNVEYTKPD